MELSGPADELLVFSGADGAFTLYDDAGDGMEYLQGEYIRIPLHWDDRNRILTLGKAEGSISVSAGLQVRLVFPDRSESVRTIRFTGEPVILSFQ